MSVAFLDSSALVKLYADEPGSDLVARLERRAVLVTSALARVEVPAALWRKARTGELDAADAQLLTRAFEADWVGTADHAERFAAVALRPPVAGHAAALCAIHPLTAYDAVMLASALAVRRVETGTAFIGFDERLNRVAAAEGLPLS